MAGAIAAAVEEQNAATQEIRQNAGQTAEMARAVCRTSLEITAEVRALPHVLVQALRTSVAEVDRRFAERFPVTLAASLALGSGNVAVTVCNLSTGSAHVAGQLGPGKAQRGKLACPGLPAGEIGFVVVEGDGDGWHLQFDRPFTPAELQPLIGAATRQRAA